MKTLKRLQKCVVKSKNVKKEDFFDYFGVHVAIRFFLQNYIHPRKQPYWTKGNTRS